MISAHTLDSANALANMISTVCPNSRLMLVVAMADDKDHIGFAKELLSGWSFKLPYIHSFKVFNISLKVVELFG